MNLDEDRMAALRQRFVSVATGQADEIASLLKRGDLEGVRKLAHGFAGRSGMFGFADLGETARLVDEAESTELPMRAKELLSALRRLTPEG